MTSNRNTNRAVASAVNRDSKPGAGPVVRGAVRADPNSHGKCGPLEREEQAGGAASEQSAGAAPRREHPIPFIDQLVLEILADRKTQTRRLPSPQNCTIDGDTCPKKLWAALDFSKAWVDRGTSPAGNPGPYLKVPTKDGETVHRVYPRVQPGDLLWVRENLFNPTSEGSWSRRFHYSADGKPSPLHSKKDKPGHRPPMHMPRFASRITLEVTGLRIEPLNSITGADVRAEGVTVEMIEKRTGLSSVEFVRHYPQGDERLIDAFACGWDHINAHRWRWALNPWVLVYEFARIEPAKASVANV